MSVCRPRGGRIRGATTRSRERDAEHHERRSPGTPPSPHPPRCARPRRSSRPTTIAMVLNSPSLTCSAAEFTPWSAVGDSSQRHAPTPTPSPCPCRTPPTTQPRPATTTGTARDEGEAQRDDRDAHAARSRPGPAATAGARAPGRPWRKEPPAQPRAPPVSESPAERGRQSALVDQGQREERLGTEERPRPGSRASRPPSAARGRAGGLRRGSSRGQRRDQQGDAPRAPRPSDAQSSRVPAYCSRATADRRRERGALAARPAALAVAALEPAEPAARHSSTAGSDEAPGRRGTPSARRGGRPGTRPPAGPTSDGSTHPADIRANTCGRWLCRIRPADDDVQRHDDRARPEALQRAPEDEDRHVGASPATTRPDGEGGDPAEERQPRTAGVGQLARDDGGEQAGDEEGAEGPAVAGAARRAP